MNRFYHPDYAVPISNKAEVQTIFPPALQVKEKCLDTVCQPPFRCIKGDCTDCEAAQTGDSVTNEEDVLWHLFSPLFCKMKDEIKWGSIGVITAPNQDKNDYNYNWRMIDCSCIDKERKKLTAFFSSVQEEPNKYLLLGKQAEYLFMETSKDKALKCLMIMPKTASANDYEDFKNITWLDTHFWGSTEIKPYTELGGGEAWNSYVSDVQAICPNTAVLFIPSVCSGLTHHQDNSGEHPVLLAGGLIWCVPVDSLDTVLDTVPQAQLYLRWCLGEIIKSCQYMGLPSDPVERLEVIVRKGKWFLFEGGDIPHRTEDCKALHFKKIAAAFKISTDEAKKYFEAVKGICLPNKPTDLGFILRVFKGFGVELENESQRVDNSNIGIHLPNSDSLVMFVALLRFLKGVPEGIQKWEITISQEKDKLHFKLVSENEENKLFNGLSDENKMTDSSGLWNTLKNTLPVEKYTAEQDTLSLILRQPQGSED